MKKQIKKISLVLVLVLSITLFSACGNRDDQGKGEEKDVIVMGTNAEFPPFEYIEGGEIVGFDVDIAKKIAEEAGKELKIENMQFSALIAALQEGKIDFIAAGMTNTPERSEQINFSKDYFTASQVIIVLKDNTTVTSGKDLEGKKIGVQLGTTGELEAKEIKDATVESYDTGYVAVMDLVNGKVDAIVIDEKPAEKFVGQNENIKILDEDLTQETYAIGVNKENEELLNQINEVIDTLIESGEYDEIYNKYFQDEDAKVE